MIIQEYKDNAAVAAAVALYLIDLVAKKKSPVFIALSGGSTPKVLFTMLANEQFKDQLDWSMVHVFWGDERCVPLDHTDSNYKMTFDALLSKIVIPEENIHRILGENDPSEEAIRYSKEIIRLLPQKNDLPVFDLIMLGMGDDGHTLSIFPHEMELLESDKVCEVATHPTSGQKRITLTGTMANNASTIAFLVTGINKAEKIQEITQQKRDWNKYPASYINPSSGTLIWFLDEAASSLI